MIKNGAEAVGACSVTSVIVRSCAPGMGTDQSDWSGRTESRKGCPQGRVGQRADLHMLRKEFGFY